MRGRPKTSRRRKRLGQHFLTDRRVLERQLGYAELRPTDDVLEIGPGLGNLTERLLEQVRSVVAVELDDAMVDALRGRGWPPERFRLVQGDAATVDYSAVGPFNKVVANLPYSASSPITFRLFGARFERAVLMYQREFADRLVAGVDSEEYGRLSAARAYFADARILENVPPSAFTPAPEVRSALVELRPFRSPPFPVATPESYLELLRVAFSTRRKTLRSTLRRHHTELGLSQWAPVEAALVAGGWADRRPEELAPEALGRLDRDLGALRHPRP